MIKTEVNVNVGSSTNLWTTVESDGTLTIESSDSNNDVHTKVILTFADVDYVKDMIGSLKEVKRRVKNRDTVN